MRVAIVTESFLPTVNGVSNSVARVAEELEALGHEILIIAPGPGPALFGNSRVVRTPSAPLIPGYSDIPVGVPTVATYDAIEVFAPDVIHVGGPMGLGAWALNVARRRNIPAVALYQTDYPRFFRHYKAGVAEGLVWRWLRTIHSMAEVTLAPSSASAWDLRQNGVKNVEIWGRGVDGELFSPSRRSNDLRATLANPDELIIGYVGRLAPEKNLQLLSVTKNIKNVRVVMVGDGPEAQRLAKLMPSARLVGYKGGVELAQHYASFDMFVHTGAHETFCQTIQEALASGVPAIGPASGGPLDLIRHGTNGYLYKPDDKRALRRAIKQMATDHAARNAMAERARPGVEDKTWAALTRQLVGHYHLAGKKLETTRTNRRGLFPTRAF